MSVETSGARQRLPLLMGSLTLLIASAAPAEDAPSASESATQLEAVKITAEQGDATAYSVKDSAAATKLPLTLRDTPQSVTVVTRERLDDQNLQSLRDVLDNTVGVYSYAYDSERVVFTSRGFAIDTLLYDGVPAVTNLSTDSLDETLDTELYERIEIVRGATGLLSGAGNPAASVNLTRKHADARTLETSLGVEYGAWDHRRATVDVSTPLAADGKVRARVIGVLQDRESYQDLYSNDKKVFYGVIDADLTPQTRLSLGYDIQDYQADAVTWGSFPLFLADGTRADWKRSVTSATDWSFWDKRKQTLFAELKQQFDNGWMLRATLSHRTFDEDLALFYVYGFPDPDNGTGLLPYAYRDRSKVKENALDAYVSGPFEALGRRHELVAGLTAAKTKASEDEVPFDNALLPPVGNFFEWDGSYPEPDFGDFASIRDEDRRSEAIYAAARISLAESLKLIAGARHNRVRREFYYTYTGDAEFDYQHSKTVPYAGLIFDFSPQFSAFASYTGIFNPQNARTQSGRYLDPTTGKSLELGIKGEHFDGRFNTALTLFRTRQDDVAELLYDENGSEVWVEGYDGKLQASQALDGVRSRGVEFEAAGSPLPGWNLAFGWSRYLLEDADDNAVKPYIPRTLIRTFTSWTPRGSLANLTLGGGVNWQSHSQLDVQNSPTTMTTVRQGSVTLFSVLARYQLTPNFSVQINGANLLDKKYYVLDEYGNLYFGTPRNGSIGLRYTF